MSDPSAPAPKAPAQSSDNPAIQQFLLRKAKFDDLRVDLTLQMLGGIDGQDGDENKWKVNGIGNISVDGQRWYNLNQEQGGRGALKLVEHVLGVRPGQALKWLEGQFSGSDSAEWKISPEEVEAQKKRRKKEFTPPERHADAIDAVKDYLIYERGLPASLIESEVQKGAIYATRKTLPNGRLYGQPRCVFISPAAAELRSVERGGFKGCCAGSQTKTSGYRVSFAQGKNEKKIALVEAAIDALSYRTLFPGRFVVSTNGSGRFILQYALATEAIDNGYGVRAAFDADAPGDKAAQKLFNALYVRELLAEKYGLDRDDIDQWFADHTLSIAVDQSPHHLFFTLGWKAEMDVAERVKGPSEPAASANFAKGADEEEEEILAEQAEENKSERWELTGAKSGPSIRLIVTKSIHEKIPVSLEGHNLKVSEPGFVHVLKKLNIQRDRPMLSKDWNEDLNRLGPEYIREYEELAAKGFPRMPSLPPVLAKMQDPPPSPARSPAP